MAREEIGKVGGFTALLTVLLIMIILLAVVGAGGGERAERQPVGHVHDRGDDADRALHGRCTCATGGRARCWSARWSASCW